MVYLLAYEIATPVFTTLYVWVQVAVFANNNFAIIVMSVLTIIFVEQVN